MQPSRSGLVPESTIRAVSIESQCIVAPSERTVSVYRGCRWLEIARDMSPSSLVYGSAGIAWPFMRLPRPSSGVPSSSRSPDGSRIATPTT